MKKYVINFNEIKNLTIFEFKNRLDKIEGINLKNLKIRDLSFYNGQFIYPGNGVYIFREEKKLIYIGKCSSMSFSERIGNHFDVRKVAWMNGLLKNLCVKLKDKNFSVSNKDQIEDEFLQKASNYIFEKGNIILINFNIEDRNKIDHVERLFLKTLDSLNSYKYKWSKAKSIL